MKGRKAFPFLLIVGLAVLMICGPVSAITQIYEEEVKELKSWEQPIFTGSNNAWYYINIMDSNPSEYDNLYFWTYEGSHNGIKMADNSESGSTSLTIDGNNCGEISWNVEFYSENATVKKSYIWMFPNSNFPKEQGMYSITLGNGLYFMGWNGEGHYPYRTNETKESVGAIAFGKSNSNIYAVGVGEYQTLLQGDWQHTLTLSDDYPVLVSLSREGCSSSFEIKEEGEVKYTNDGTEDISTPIALPEFDIYITSPSETKYSYHYISDEPISNTASVITRVKSLSDKSLIAGSKVYYRALDGSDLQNKTLPSGSDEFILQKNVEYEYWAEASGYENQTSIPSSSIFTGDTFNDIWLVPTLEDPEEGTGLYNFYISEQTAIGQTASLTSPAYVTLNGETKLTTSAGYASFEVNKTTSISYKIQKDGYVSVSRTYTPNWPGNTINEFISIRQEGVVLPGEPTAAPTPDHRDSEEKAESALNIIFDNVELFATLASFVLLLSFMKWMKI